MSLIGAALSWTRLPQWALELLVIGVIAGGIWWWHHETYAAGIHWQQVADNKASAKAEMQAAVATQAALDAANRAEESYRAEIARNQAFAAANPLPAVRLCDDSSRTNVPQASAADSRVTPTGATSGSVRGVPAGNIDLRGRRSPDISRLLGSLARRADQVSAELREDQSR